MKISIGDNGVYKPEGGLNISMAESGKYSVTNSVPSTLSSGMTIAASGVEILRLTKDGMYYKGEFVPDAGAAHKAFMETMEILRTGAASAR